jgi:Ser/Thr protein kinase RdoA (MazF antagonist)
MPLFDTTPVDAEVVRALVKQHFDLELGANVKASQNHTFLATLGTEENAKKFAVRVTPDPTNARKASIELEVKFLDFLHEHGLPVCPAIASKVTGEKLVRDGSLSICAFQYATGEPVVYQEWKWMTNKDIVVGQGKWIGKLHVLSKQFTKDNAELVKSSARHYSELHDGVLREVPIHEDDQKTRSDPEKYGLIHGDVNPSNYFWNAELGLPCMFDWDQAHLCWFLYDLSSPIWSVVTLQDAGSPIDLKPVPEANVKQFTEWLIEGYESTSNSGLVDRAALDRMIKIRRELYWRFCSQAVKELDPESFMGKFCQFMVNWLQKSQ